MYTFRCNPESLRVPDLGISGAVSMANDRPHHHHVLHSPGGPFGEFWLGVIQGTNSEKTVDVCASLSDL